MKQPNSHRPLPHAHSVHRSVVMILVLGAAVSSPLSAQLCNDPTGGGKGKGNECLEPDTPAAVRPLPVDWEQRLHNFTPPTGSPMGGGGFVGNLVDGQIPGIGSPDTGIDTLFGNAGSWHAASGEFRDGVDLMDDMGGAPGSGFALSALYRRSVAHASFAADIDPSEHSAFGTGWLSSFAEALVNPVVPGQTVTFVDRYGASHTVPLEETHSGGGGGPASVIYEYAAVRGSRLICDNGTWYREFPSRVRIEYASTGNIQAGSIATRIHRIYYGVDPNSPVWQIPFTYGGTGRLTKIKGIRGHEISLTWMPVGSASVLRITKVPISKTTSSGGAWPDPTGGNYDWSKHDGGIVKSCGRRSDHATSTLMPSLNSQPVMTSARTSCPLSLRHLFSAA